MELAGLGKPSINSGHTTETRKTLCWLLSEPYLPYPESRLYLKSGRRFDWVAELKRKMNAQPQQVSHAVTRALIEGRLGRHGMVISARVYMRTWTLRFCWPSGLEGSSPLSFINKSSLQVPGEKCPPRHQPCLPSLPLVSRPITKVRFYSELLQLWSTVTAMRRNSFFTKKAAEPDWHVPSSIGGTHVKVDLKGVELRQANEYQRKAYPYGDTLLWLRI